MISRVLRKRAFQGPSLKEQKTKDGRVWTTGKQYFGTGSRRLRAEKGLESRIGRRWESTGEGHKERYNEERVRPYTKTPAETPNLRWK